MTCKHGLAADLGVNFRGKLHSTACWGGSIGVGPQGWPTSGAYAQSVSATTGTLFGLGNLVSCLIVSATYGWGLSNCMHIARLQLIPALAVLSHAL